MPGFCVIKLEGKDLKPWAQEAGGHRVQRVPPTEKRGRVHTSTVTVAVLEYPSEQAIEILDKDLTIEWFSGTGPGGQNRNKVMASCRLRHTPTGIVVSAQTRSRVTSLAQAKAELTSRIHAQCNARQHLVTSQERKQQVGSGQRGDKIRTIQIQHDCVVDHRTGKRCSAESYLKGEIYKLWL